MLVAAQINFEEVGELVHSQARRVQKRLGEDWTALRASPQIRVTFTPTGPIQETRAAYRLTSSDSFWSLTLNPDSVTLESRKYGRWEGMAYKLAAVAGAVAEVFDPSQCLRLRLRYIDQIPLPEGEHSWDGLIKESVRGLVNAPTFGRAILGSDQRHLLLLDEQARCMFHHGLLADDVGASEQMQKYLLDYDVFVEIPTSFDVDQVTATANQLHGYIGALFRSSIEDKLYEWLEGDQ